MSYTDEQLKDIFNLFDEDGSGCIPAKELENALKQLAYGDDVAKQKAQVRFLEHEKVFKVVLYN